MSASEAFASDITAGDISLPVLNLKSYGELEAHYRQRRRELHKALLKESGMPETVIAKEIAAMEVRGVNPSEIHTFTESDDGVKEVLKLAIKQGNLSITVPDVMSGVSPYDRVMLAGQLAGFLKRDPVEGDANPPLAEPSSTGKTDTSASADTTQAPTPQA